MGNSSVCRERDSKKKMQAHGQVRPKDTGSNKQQKAQKNREKESNKRKRKLEISSLDFKAGGEAVSLCPGPLRAEYH